MTHYDALRPRSQHTRQVSRRQVIVSAIVGATVAPFSRLSLADTYPAQPIRLIVPTPAGGGTDIIGRIAGDYLTRALGKTFVIDNQGGAGGQIGSQAVARSEPDGYTLLLGFVSTHGTLPAIRKLPYDPTRSFTPIAMIGGAPNVLVCRAQGGPADFAAFLAECRAKPAKYSFGSGGPGTITHLVFEHLKLATHLDIVHVPYKGIAPVMTDIMGGQVQYAMPGLAGAVQYIKAGRLRALAVTGPRRHSLLPNVPTLGELGLGEFDAVQWVGLMGPAKLPQAVTVRLHEATQRMLLTPDLKERLAKAGVDAMPMSTAAFAEYVEKDQAVWRRVVKDSGIKMEA